MNYINVILFIVFWATIITSLVVLYRNSNAVYIRLDEMYNKAMYCDKAEIPTVRNELLTGVYNEIWHKHHYYRYKQILSVIDTRQRYNV